MLELLLVTTVSVTLVLSLYLTGWILLRYVKYGRGTIITKKDTLDLQNLVEISMMIRHHNHKTAKLRDMDKVKHERIKFEHELGLHRILKQLYKYINLYPVWYAKPDLKRNEQPFWYSSVIKPNQLTIERLGQSAFSNLIDRYYLTPNTEILNYQFTAQKNTYNLIYIKTFEYFKAIYVYENKTNLVYKYHAEVLAFKPGAWIIHVIKIADEVIKDEERQSWVNQVKMREFHERDIKKNFLN